MARVRTVEILQGFLVQITFTDDSQREVDLEPYLHGPIFDAIRRDRDSFLAVRVDDRMGTLVWPNGADIDPDVLYRRLTPVWMENASPTELDDSNSKSARAEA
jgi:hypothetical protein